MSPWGTGDTRNLVPVITAVIRHKISSYQFIKLHRITLKYYELTKQIWLVKSQFLNNFYAEMPLWSCRIFCKTAMEANILRYTQIPHFKLHARSAYISHSISVYLHFSTERDKLLRKVICGKDLEVWAAPAIPKYQFTPLQNYNPLFFPLKRLKTSHFQSSHII